MKYADYTQAVNGTNNTNVMTPLRVKQAIQANESGGGSGTSNYNDLENKPKINGVTLEGDKSSSDLGISVPSVDEETIIKSPNLTAIGVKESSGNVDHFLTLTLSEYNAIENKDPNTFYNITDDTDPSSIPTKTSDLVNDSGFITSSDLEEAMRENNIYSTNETKIGTWIDGKPLYRKVIQPVIEIGANATVSVPHGISNLSQVLKVDATLFWWNKTYPLPAIYEDLSKQVAINYIDSTNVYIKSFGDNWSSQITTIILEYTKTTD
jgi:hypothetical protein